MKWNATRLERWSVRTDVGVGAIAMAAFALLIAENTDFGVSHSLFFRRANLTVMTLFAVDVLVRLLAEKDRRRALWRSLPDLIVFAPLIQFILGIESTPFWMLVRQAVIVLMLISRSRRAGRLMRLLRLQPAQMMAFSFLGAIGFGVALLMLPASTATVDRMPLVDALFTASSAVCVTGLIVEDTAMFFTPFGKAVLVGLIQVGGLGIMTFSVTLIVLAGRAIPLKRQVELQNMLEHESLADTGRMIRFIVGMTFAVEAAGALALAALWAGRFDSAAALAGHAVFHAVSAFCNAGFSTFSDSLTAFADDPATLSVISLLIIVGGLGFFAVRDLVRRLRPGAGERRRPLRIQTRVALWVSLLLILAGAAALVATERGPGAGTGALRALFQSISARTAGFNTVEIGALSSAGLLTLMLLMFVGGSPGSTAGGIKTTTFAVLWVAAISGFRRRPLPELYRRSLPFDLVTRAVGVFLLGLTAVAASAAVLMAVEDLPFRDILFETISAFATVGLSTGITPDLSPAGRLILSALMFLGRVGPLTLAYAFMTERRPPGVRYPTERIMIG
jgi:trk system potassium uptake protein